MSLNQIKASFLLSIGLVTTSLHASTNEELWNAVKSQHVSAVCNALQDGADPSMCNEKGSPVLHLAISRGGLEIIEHLLNAGAELKQFSQQYPNISHPVYYALSFAKVPNYPVREVLILLLHYGATIPERDIHGNTVYDCCNDEDIHIIHMVTLNKYIMESDFKNAKDLLVDCAHRGIKDKVVNCKGWQGRTLLHRFVSEGREKAVRFLLKHGALTSLQDAGGDTPLHTAVTYSHERIARLLVDEGAWIWRRDNKGRSPKDLASEMGIQWDFLNS